MSIIYTGVGSRKVKAIPEVYNYITKLSERLAHNGFTLRTDDAVGSDEAFRVGAGRVPSTPMEVYSAHDAEGDSRASEMAAAMYPAWNRCSAKAKLLHARNCYQVLGMDLNTPAEFFICWTPNGSETEAELDLYKMAEGGTATAIRLAYRNNIPIFNLKNPDAVSRLYSFLRSKYSLGN
jgi:hypothetical protein